LVFNYNVQYQIVINVSTYDNLTTKNFITRPLRILSPLIFASWCLRYDSSSSQSTYLDSILQCTSFQFGNILMEPFAMVIETAPMF
jgi:hypothetical protein